MNIPAFARAFAVLSACSLVGCGNTGAPARDYGPLLEKLSLEVILPEHQAFASRADELASSLQALVDTLLSRGQLYLGVSGLDPYVEQSLRRQPCQGGSSFSSWSSLWR